MGLARLAALHGVATFYEPSEGVTVAVPDATVVAVLAALGVDASGPAAVRDALDRAEAAATGRLLPPTVVLWPEGDVPAPLTGLPAGTTLRVEPEAGGTLEWLIPGAEGVGRLERASAGPRFAADAADGAADGEAAAPAASGGPEPGSGRPAVAAEAGPGRWRLPYGVHQLYAEAPDGRTARATLVVAPARVPQPDGRSHGLLVQLYSLLSARSWGMGDLGDLADLATWSGRSLGASFVQVNPLHAAVPGTPTDPSPYRPSSRRFPDPVHLRVEDIPEYAYAGARDRQRLDELRDKGAGLRESVLRKGALIDRDAVWTLKREALEIVHRIPLGPGRRAAYCDFLAEQGQALEDHATWCALAEVHGPEWHSWPAALRDPGSAGTARARRELMDRVDFHSRLVWLTDRQLAAAGQAARDAGMGVGIVHDLAVGVHPGGADAWAQREAFAAGMSVGAPPDAFNARGQDWGLPPWRPDVLAASGYAPYRGLLRGLLRNAGALRIDHVMGLFRLWWVPEGSPPTDGTYVRYDADAMLAVLALEAHRAGAVVVGEDLGTVEPGVREALSSRGVLGTSVLWFERDWAGTGRPLRPEEWREGCVATATTHDLPSTAARLTGGHVELRHRLGLLTRPLEQERTQDAADVAEWLGVLSGLGLLPEGTGDEEGRIRAVYRFLLRTPARMVGVWLPDAVGDRRPQNLPGTWDQYPNWRLPVADAAGHPVTLEELAASPRLHALMDVFAEAAADAARALPCAPPGALPGARTAPPDARPR
ncbi:4-alpha-glucanotransferase [Streptomyces lunaelactis]|uniref:4-alpha-glucanotransferase n=1 Tax=Streptomyces lunaelactis TaxID=1535768 RepID=UPI00158559F6|nr:4-alpha-glucanotransferase [Streptomyces lunaelactis]NUK36891.1 4-alpha-glucanotransferase [Streptomyces lunaelactis]NUK43693.1 4-alpha-glucanotransferase [Streptomyces lunaelactis]NUK94330.1 4-alpha-glucanotransferase [Streptomyces lunaelactis]NUL32322.1 4-alpha-glucanotransferase [Streptomyces lunaelactis]